MSNKCPKLGHIMAIFWTFPWSLDMISMSYYKCPKCDQNNWALDTFFFAKMLLLHVQRIFLCSGTFWTFPWCLDMFLWHTTYVQNNCKGFGCFFGHNEEDLTCFGHHLNFGCVLVTFVDTFWTFWNILHPKCVYTHILYQYQNFFSIIRGSREGERILLRRNSPFFDRKL